MEGFAKSSLKQYTTYGIMVLIRFCRDNNLEVNMQSILEFSRELQKSKKAATPVAAAFAMYKIFCSALCIEIPPSEVIVYKARVKIHTKAFNARDNKRWRYPISLTDISTLWDNPPKSCNNTHWQAFLSLSWVFLLRKNEAFGYRNGDLKKKYNDKGAFIGWSLSILNNKNCTNKNETRVVFFKTKEVPEIFHSCLNKLASCKISAPFSSLPHPNIIIEHLRITLNVDTSKYVVVIHSFRHGRPEHLANVLNFSEQQIMKAGRWTTSKSRRVYQHS